MLQWGKGKKNYAPSICPIVFPKKFDSACLGVIAIAHNSTANSMTNGWYQVVDKSNDGCTLYAQYAEHVGEIYPFYIAIGK